MQNVPPGPAAAILARLPVDAATAIALGLDPFTAAAVLDGLDALVPANATAGANATATTVPAVLGRLPHLLICIRFRRFSTGISSSIKIF